MTDHRLPLLSSNEELLFSGYMTKSPPRRKAFDSFKSPKKRLFVLTKNKSENVCALRYYDPDDLTRAKGEIPLEGATIEAKDSHSFLIRTLASQTPPAREARDYFLAVDDQEKGGATEWLEQLRSIFARPRLRHNTLDCSVSTVVLHEKHPCLGYGFELACGGEKGAVIIAVTDQGPALESRRIFIGDIVVAINDQSVKGLSESAVFGIIEASSKRHSFLLTLTIMPGRLNIKEKDIEKDIILGEGNFGFVRKGKWFGIAVAIKKPKPCFVASSEENESARLKEENLRKEFIEEVNILTRLRHRNVVQTFGASIEEELLVVTEFLENGDLLSYLQKDSIHFSLLEYGWMAQDVARGMQYVASQNISHRDLAARNVLVGACVAGAYGVCKVSDFGMSRVGKGTVEGTCRLSVLWASPETLTNLCYHEPSDVWSFGILLHEIFSKGSQPYPELQAQGLGLMQIVDEVLGGTTMPKHAAIPPHVFNLMTECWAREPAQRPCFSALAQRLQEWFPNPFNE